MSARVNGSIWIMRGLFILYVGLEILLFLRVIPALAVIAWGLRIAVALLTYVYVKSMRGNAMAWTAFVFLVPFAATLVASPLAQKLSSSLIVWVAIVFDILPVVLVLVGVRPRAASSRPAAVPASPRPVASTAGSAVGGSSQPVFTTSDPESARLAAELKSKGYSDADLLRMSEMAKGIAQSMYEQKTGVSTCRKCGKSLKAMQSGVYGGGGAFFDMLSNTPYNCKSCGAPFCVDCMTKLRKAAGSGRCPVCGGDIGW